MERIEGERFPRSVPISDISGIAELPQGIKVDLTPIVYTIDHPNGPWHYATLVDRSLRYVTLQLNEKFHGSLDGTDGKCVSLKALEVMDWDASREKRLNWTIDTKKQEHTDAKMEGLQVWFEEKGLEETYEKLPACPCD